MLAPSEEAAAVQASGSMATGLNVPSSPVLAKSLTSLSSAPMDAPVLKTADITSTEAVAATLIGAPLDALPVSLPNYILDAHDSRGRRIVAEDFTMNMAPLKKLSERCLDVLISNFTKRPLLKQLPPKFRSKLLKVVSVEVPLTLAAKLIDDEGEADDGSMDGALYWRRACLKHFSKSKCDPLLHGRSWKSTFFELLLEELLEQHIPEVSDQGQLMEYVRIASSFVKRLRIKQLRPAQWVPTDRQVPGSTVKNLMQHIPIYPASTSKVNSIPSTHNSASKTLAPKPVTAVDTKTAVSRPGTTSGSLLAEKQQKSGAIKPNEMRTEPVHHLDMRFILGELNHLTDLQLFYGMNDCGMSFSWNLFGITFDDAFHLSQGLSRAKNLKQLSLQANHITDDLCQLLCCGLKECTNLEVLDLGHNSIQDVGACALATLISTAGPSTRADETLHLKELDLSNNQITVRGVVALGKALAQNTTLQTLNLRLNTFISDEGGCQFIQCFYMDNFSLKNLTLAGCQIGPKTIHLLADAIKHYGVVNTRLAYEKEHPGSAGRTMAEQQDQPRGSAERGFAEDDEDDAASAARNLASASKRKSAGNKLKGGKSSAAKQLQTQAIKAGAAAGNKKGAKPSKNSRVSSVAATKSQQGGRLRSSARESAGNRLEDNTASSEQREISDFLQELTGDAVNPSNSGEHGKLFDLRSRISFPAGIMRLDISSNTGVVDEPCGKELFDAVKVNRYLVRLDTRGTEVSEHYLKAIHAVVSTNKEQVDPDWVL